LAPHEGNVAHRVMTPRLFEALALRTALVLVPGHYCGILRPWDHYVPLQENGGNAEEVARALQDGKFLQAMADRAYREIVQSGRYSESQFAARVDEVLRRAVETARHARFRSAGRYHGFVLRTALRRMAVTRSSRCRAAIFRLTSRIPQMIYHMLHMLVPSPLRRQLRPFIRNRRMRS
jgi:hypothetical protein